jgi:SUMO ligase MMS21 Smc5/6 complex component
MNDLLNKSSCGSEDSSIGLLNTCDVLVQHVIVYLISSDCNNVFSLHTGQYENCLSDCPRLVKLFCESLKREYSGVDNCSCF